MRKYKLYVYKNSTTTTTTNIVDVQIHMKVHSGKINNNKNMIPATEITNTSIIAFISDLVFHLLSCKVLFINIKDNRNC